LETRRLGKSTLEITKVGIGTAPIGSTPEWSVYWGPQDEKVGIKTIRTTIDAGVNWIDTAPFYGWGRPSRLLEKQSRDGETKSTYSPNAERSPTAKEGG